MGELTHKERGVLLFEAQDWGSAGRKESAIPEMLAMSPTTYYQILNALLDREEALAEYPVLVNRLRRIREQGQRQRGRSTT